jgi:hypothetical protein
MNRQRGDAAAYRPDHPQAMVTWAMIAVMTRRLARPHRPPSIQTNAT